MSKTEIGTWISGIGLVAGVFLAAGSSFIGDKTADIRTKVGQHEVSIVRLETVGLEIIRRLERIEKKIDSK
jgi:hypothetical protein